MKIERHIFTQRETTAEKVKGYLLAIAIGVGSALLIAGGI